VTLFRARVEEGWEAAPVAPGAVVELGRGAALAAFPSGKGCALLAGGGVRLNGNECLPIEVLADRDEVRVERATFYFSACSPAAETRFAGGRKTRCPRCQSVLAEGEAVIACPACSAPHHPACWGYAPACGGCRAVTSDGGWTPDELEEGAR
jgi:hypothetical protein